MPTDRSPGTKPNQDRELTRGAFDKLLARLDPDRDEAGRKYDELRRKLTKFFGLWGCSSPEEYADESLDRTARKMFEGQEIQNLNGFLLGVARLVHKEMVKREIRERRVAEGLHRVSAAGRDPGQDEKRLRCYEHCLTTLAADDRNLFVKYYQGEGRTRARQREELCLHLEITLNLLRVRAFRVRKSLARCIRECLGQQSEDVTNLAILPPLGERIISR